MPAELLLPLFALTLLANAALVAFALRGLRRGQSDQDSRSWSGRASGSRTPAAPDPARTVPDPHRPAPVSLDRPLTDALVRAIALRRERLDPPAGDPAVEPPRGPAEPTPAPRSETAGDAAPVEATPPVQEAAPAPGPAKKRPARAPKAARTNDGGQPPEPARRGRRRFALPPLDDDHDKVSRSIESFLAGSDGPADPAVRPVVTPAPGATTVALVAVHGLPELSDIRGSQPGRRTRSNRRLEDETTTLALAMVERTIRAAARGSDVVTVAGRGRFRIVLAATGELAARAYLRRIRATVEPLLEAEDRPLGLAMATATVLDESIADAERHAVHRLAATLEALADRRPVNGPIGATGAEADPDIAQPRVAPD